MGDPLEYSVVVVVIRGRCKKPFKCRQLNIHHPHATPHMVFPDNIFVLVYPANASYDSIWLAAASCIVPSAVSVQVGLLLSL